MEEDALESADPGLPGPEKIAPVDPNAPAGTLPVVAPLTQAMQRHAEGLFAPLLSQGRGATHERQLLRLGGTHGQRAPVLQTSFGGADRPPQVIFPAPFCPHQRAL
jgi:hypothetical protein